MLASSSEKPQDISNSHSLVQWHPPKNNQRYVWLRRGPHPPGTSRERCWHRWKPVNRPRTRQCQNGAGCPLSAVVGSWFLPEPGPEPPSELLSHRRWNPTFQADLGWGRWNLSLAATVCWDWGSVIVGSRRDSWTWSFCGGREVFCCSVLVAIMCSEEAEGWVLWLFAETILVVGVCVHESELLAVVGFVLRCTRVRWLSGQGWLEALWLHWWCGGSTLEFPVWRVLLELDFCDCCSGGGGGLGWVGDCLAVVICWDPFSILRIEGNARLHAEGTTT